MEKLMPVAFAIGLTFMWAAASLLMSHVGGWANLAKHYPDNVDEQGETHGMCNGYVGVISYKLCLILGVCKNGLRLSVLLPFRIGHPPVFIPWDQFHSVYEKRVLFFRVLDTYVGTPVVANVVLPIWVRDHLPAQQSTE